MILDLSISSDYQKARTYLGKLLNEKAKIELVKIHPKRTGKQNRYVHAIFALFGVHFGYSVEESKTLIKRELGYVYEKNGHEFLRKTSEMTTKELTEFIDRMRNYSAANGCWLPSADEFNADYVGYMKEVERAKTIEGQYGY
jgi:hypothetical protein